MFKEAYLLFIVKLLTAALGFSITAIVARQLTSIEVGSYFFILSLINIVIPFSLAGLGYNIIKLEDGLGRCFGFSVFFITLSSFLISILLVALYYFGFLFSEVKLDVVGWLILPLITINCLSDFLSYVYQKLKKAWLGAALLVLLRQLIMVVMLFSTNSLTFDNLIVFSLLSGVVSLLVSFYCVQKKISISLPSISDGLLYLSQSKDFMFNHVMATINGSFIPVMLGILSTSSNVAYFTIALKVVSLTSFILIPLNRVVAPRYSKNFNENDLAGLSNTSKFSSRLAILLTVPLVGGMFVFSELILLYFGEAYLENSLVILQVMLVGQLVNGLSGSVGWLLQMSSNEKIYRNISLVNIFFTVLLAFILINLIGPMGAGIAYCFSLIFMNLVSFFYVKKVLNINIYKFW